MLTACSLMHTSTVRELIATLDVKIQQTITYPLVAWQMDMYIAEWLKGDGFMLHALNDVHFGWLANPSSHNETKSNPDFFMVVDNPTLWEETYLHPSAMEYKRVRTGANTVECTMYPSVARDISACCYIYIERRVSLLSSTTENSVSIPPVARDISACCYIYRTKGQCSQ